MHSSLLSNELSIIAGLLSAIGVMSIILAVAAYFYIFHRKGGKGKTRKDRRSLRSNQSTMDRPRIMKSAGDNSMNRNNPGMARTPTLGRNIGLNESMNATILMSSNDSTGFPEIMQHTQLMDRNDGMNSTVMLESNYPNGYRETVQHTLLMDATVQMNDGRMNSPTGLQETVQQTLVMDATVQMNDTRMNYPIGLQETVQQTLVMDSNEDVIL
jgi:hypothetical protein